MISRFKFTMGVFFAAACLAPDSVLAQTAYTGTNVPIVAAGCQMGGSNCYFKPSTNPNSCSFGMIFINISSPVGRALYASVLAAQMLRKQADISYVKSSDGSCSLAAGSTVTLK